MIASNACFRPDLIESTKSKATLRMLAHYPALGGFSLCARGLISFAHLQRGAVAGLRVQFRQLPVPVFARMYLNRPNLFFLTHIQVQIKNVYVCACVRWWWLWWWWCFHDMYVVWIPFSSTTPIRVRYCPRVWKMQHWSDSEWRWPLQWTGLRSLVSALWNYMLPEVERWVIQCQGKLRKDRLTQIELCTVSVEQLCWMFQNLTMSNTGLSTVECKQFKDKITYMLWYTCLYVYTCI